MLLHETFTPFIALLAFCLLQWSCSRLQVFSQASCTHNYSNVKVHAIGFVNAAVKEIEFIFKLN